VETLDERTCGVWVVDIRNGETVGFLRFESGVQEIFAVQAIPARFPEMLPWGDERMNTSYVVPDEALRDVPAALTRPAPVEKPEEPPFAAAINRGAALLDEDRVEEAIALLEQAREMNPNAAVVYNNLGNAFTAQNRLREAVAQYEQAIERNPDLADAHMNLGMALLKLGELPRGFAEFDWRWKTNLFTPFLPPQPRWDGSPLPGKTLLVHTEQGAGDTIQFARYLPLARERVGRLLVVAPEPLQALMASVEGVDEVRGAGEIPAAAFDAYIPMMTLGGIIGTTLETIPAEIPYIWTGDGGQEIASPTIQLPSHPTARLKIGIAWAGSPTQGNDRNRSARLADFAPLFELPGIAWHSLQVGEKARELAAFESPVPITDLSPQLKTWADTAAAVSQLDLVIAVDTGVVHLAGALGVPAWVLLCHAPDWRWLLDRPDSPWYPQHRLFRQSKPKNWEGVFGEAAEALRGEVGR